MTTPAKEYRTPSPVMIPRDGATRLYELKEKLHRQLEACGREWLKVAIERGIIDRPQARGDAGDFWRVALPQALFDLLESYDRHASIAAARAFVAFHDSQSQL